MHNCVLFLVLGADDLKLEIEKSLQTKGASASAYLDRLMSSSMNVVTSEVNNALFPRGLLKPFPHNCLSLMTTTGAKGGLVSRVGYKVLKCT